MPRTLRTAEDVWAFVDKDASESGCWLWTGALTTSGYGQFFYGGRKHTVHRLTYQLVKGAIAEGLTLDHLCRVRRCCNPDHLEPVTIQVNIGRAPRWKGNLTTCPAGHPYAGDNLYVRPSDGARICRRCNLHYSRKSKRKMRAARTAAGLTTRGTVPVEGHDGGPGCPGTVSRP